MMKLEDTVEMRLQGKIQGRVFSVSCQSRWTEKYAQ